MKFISLPGEKTNSQVTQRKTDHTKWFIWFKFIVYIIRKRQRVLKQPLREWIVNFEQMRKKYINYQTARNL